MPNIFNNGNEHIHEHPGTTTIIVERKRLKVSNDVLKKQRPENENLKSLKLDLKKIYVPMENAYYHLMVDSFSSISKQAISNPGSVFLIPRSIFDESPDTIDSFFIGLKRMYNVSYVLLDDGEYEVKNLSITSQEGLSSTAGVYSQEVYLAFSNEASLSLVPHRKVYLSRGVINDKSVQVVDYKTRNINHRISDEHLLEDFFRDLGFEIVYAETLTVEEKVKLFAETKILASVTSAGLANCMLMKPGTMMIELLVPIIWENKIELYTRLYSKVAAFKSMSYLCLSSINNSGEEILDQLETYRNLISDSGLAK